MNDSNSLILINVPPKSMLLTLQQNTFLLAVWKGQGPCSSESVLYQLSYRA